MIPNSKRSLKVMLALLLTTMFLGCETSDGENSSSQTGNDTKKNELYREEDCFEGDFHMTTQSDYLSFVDYPCITGSLFVQQPEFTTLSLPELVHVGQSLTIIVTANSLLINVELEKLHSIGKSLSITSTSIKTIELGGVEYINGDMLAISGDSLESIDLHSLIATPSLDISLNPKLSILNLEKLEGVGTDLWIEENPSLQTIDLSSLRTIGANNIDNIGELIISCNRVLESVNLVNLANVFWLHITFNPLLEDDKIIVADELKKEVMYNSSNSLFADHCMTYL